MKNVIVIGSGVGGLCSALRLLHKGYKVKIIEKEDKIGGKVNIIESNNSRFDLSASIIMTPNVYTNIFEEVGKNYKDYFEIEKLDINYKVFFEDKTSIIISFYKKIIKKIIQFYLCLI